MSLRPPDPSQPDFWHRWVDRSRAIASKVQIHKCYGDPDARTGCFTLNDADGTPVCKAGFDENGDKPLVPATTLTADGELQLKRSHPRLNHYNPAMSVALRCNMDIKVILSGLHALSLIFYISDYATKPQHSTGVTEDLIKAGLRKYATALDKAQDEGDHERAAWMLESRALVIRCLTALNSKIQTSAAEAVTFLLDEPMLYKSHEVANVKFSGMLWYIDQHFPDVKEDFITDAPVPSSMRQEGEELDKPRAALWVADDGQVVGLNALHDYMYRPAEIALPLYLFYEQYKKVTAGYKGGKTKGKRHFGKNALRFDPKHPQYATHYLVPLKTAVVPWIQGPMLSRDPTANPERFGKLASSLLKVWWTFDDLRDSTQTWTETWQAHVDTLANFNSAAATKQESYVHTVVLRVLRNSTAMHAGLETVSQERAAREIHRAKFKTTRMAGASGAENPMQEAFRQYLCEQPLCLPSYHNSDMRSHKFARQALDIILQHCPRKKPRRVRSGQPPAWDDWTQHAWTKQNHRTTAKFAKGLNERMFQAMLDGKPPMADTTSKSTDPATVILNPVPVEPALLSAPILPTIGEVADLFTLNEKQRHAFLTIAEVFMQEYNGEHVPVERRERVAQLLMYIGGSGGVGKSRVIAAAVHLFTAYGRKHWLRLCAYTAFAAGQIGGTTTHALMGEMTMKQRKRDVTYNPSAKTMTTLQRVWSEARFCIVDECSMLSCHWNGLLSARMQAARAGISDGPYGGVHLIFCGDFNQLPPISTTGRPLYTNPEWLRNAKLNRSEIGRQLWDSLTHAVVLDQGMRAAGDPKFQHFLERLRAGESRLTPARGGTYIGSEPDDFDYIHQRLVDKLSLSTQQQTDLFHNGGICTRNVVRLLTNNDAAIREAVHRGVQPMIAVAQDGTTDPKDHLSFKVRRSLLQRHESAETGTLAGMLILVPGMRYALKKHQARDLPGLSRNSTGILLKVVLDEREPPSSADPSQPRFLKFMPTQVIMYFPDAPNIRFHPALPPKTLSIVPSGVATNQQTAKKNTIRRWQLPFVLASFGTDFNNQGRTFDGTGFVDLARPTDPSGYNAATPYVCLSRFTQLEDIILLRPIPLQAFKRKIGHDQQTDWNRLKSLSEHTINNNNAAFEEHFPDFDPQQPIARKDLHNTKEKPLTLADVYALFRSAADDLPVCSDDSTDDCPASDDDYCDDHEPSLDERAAVTLGTSVPESTVESTEENHRHRPPRQSKRNRTSLPAVAPTEEKSDDRPRRRSKRHRTSIPTVPLRKRRPVAMEHADSWMHISPPPGPWTHNNCGPYAVLEVCNMLLRCVPDLRDLLPPATLNLLDTLMTDRMRPSTITRRTPWQQEHVCPCADCYSHGRTAQDSNIEQRLYSHMNTQRSTNDKQMEQSGDYIVGGFCDIRRMFEATLALRTPDGQPLPGCGLSVVNRCCICATERVVPVPTLEVDDAVGKPLPGAPHGSTQEILNQHTGVVGMLHHLPANPYEHLGAVKMFGGQCPNCVVDGKRMDTMLPYGLDPTQPLPPILRFNKAIGSDRITSIPDTVCLQHPDDPAPTTYTLLATIYGNRLHFTTDVRYHIDEGSRAFTHYDPFHFRSDRVLELSNDQPACNGGRPDFLPHHTRDMREKFLQYTQISHVASAIYGRITNSNNNGPLAPLNTVLEASTSSNSAERQSRQLSADPSIHLQNPMPSDGSSSSITAVPTSRSSSPPELLCNCHQDLSEAMDDHLICCDFCEV